MNGNDEFITPEIFEKEKYKLISGPNGWLLFVDCDKTNQNIKTLAEKVKKKYEENLLKQESELKEIILLQYSDEKKKAPLITVFEDTETCPTIPKHSKGSNAFVFSSVKEMVSGRTVNENLMRLLQTIRTLKVNGAKNITAVIPYYPYSRQDKPTHFKREATLAEFTADLLRAAGANEILTYHLHSDAIKGFFEPDIKVTALNGLDLFREIFNERQKDPEAIVVSTDAGGAKATIHLAKAIDVDYAITNKYRPQKEKADLLGVIGFLDDKKIAIITDDETVTFSSILNATKILSGEYNIPVIKAAISHMKLPKEKIPRLIEAHEKYNLKEIHFTDSVPQIKEILELPFAIVHSLDERFALTINNLHYNRSVSRLFYKPTEK